MHHNLYKYRLTAQKAVNKNEVIIFLLIQIDVSLLRKQNFAI